MSASRAESPSRLLNPETLGLRLQQLREDKDFFSCVQIKLIRNTFALRDRCATMFDRLSALPRDSVLQATIGRS